uniref:Uncharacterized protein n=1 Tax=Heterorhabditis bacteriophora TaxID=37862 RepID=A0A1I7WQ27_HETBA
MDTTTYAQIIESRFRKHLTMKVILHIRARPITATALLDKIGTVLKQEATVDRIYSDNRNSAFLLHRPPFIKPNERSEQLMPQSSTFAAESAFRKSEKRNVKATNHVGLAERSTIRHYAATLTNLTLIHTREIRVTTAMSFPKVGGVKSSVKEDEK